MEESDSLHKLVPNSRLPRLLRAHPASGTILTLVFGGGATSLAYLQEGWYGLHGIWISAVLLILYFFIQDYFRMRRAIQDHIVSSPHESMEYIVHYQSDPHPNSLDYKFWPDDDTKKKVGTDICQTLVIENVIKVTRPYPIGRYLSFIRNYKTGPVIPVRNKLTRNIRVSFEYKTSDPMFTIGFRLRNRKHEGQKDPYGNECLGKAELTSKEWVQAPPILLVAGIPLMEFRVSIELLNENNPPGPGAFLFLRKVMITEDQ